MKESFRWGIIYGKMYKVGVPRIPMASVVDSARFFSDQ
jgi:hypothetical protein